MAVGPTITRRHNGCGSLSPLAENGIIAPITRNRCRMYEFEVSTAERSDDDNARSVCKGEGKVLIRALSTTHPRMSSTTLPLRRFRGDSPSSSSSSPRHRLRSNEDFIFATPSLHRAGRWSQDSVRYTLFSPGYPYRPSSCTRGNVRRYVWCVRQTNPLDVFPRAYSIFPKYRVCPPFL